MLNLFMHATSLKSLFLLAVEVVKRPKEMITKRKKRMYDFTFGLGRQNTSRLKVPITSSASDGELRTAMVVLLLHFCKQDGTSTKIKKLLLVDRENFMLAGKELEFVPPKACLFTKLSSTSLEKAMQ